MPGEWLNDEIINFYGAMILARSEDCQGNTLQVNCKGNTKKSLNVHYFSTFFWSKLSKEGYEQGRLAKWTKKVCIFIRVFVDLTEVFLSARHFLKRYHSHPSKPQQCPLDCRSNQLPTEAHRVVWQYGNGQGSYFQSSSSVNCDRFLGLHFLCSG